MRTHTMLSLKKQAHRLLYAVPAAFCAICLLMTTVKAQVNIITQDTTRTVNGTGNGIQIGSASNVRYEIADGVTWTLTRTGTSTNNGGAILVGAGASLIIGPQNSTGRVVFENNIARSMGGAIQASSADSYLEITNALFRSNQNGYFSDTQIGNGVGSAIMNSVAGVYIKLKDVVFESNRSFGNSTIRITGNLVMEGGGFYDNYAAGDHTGGLHTNGAPNVTLTNVVFNGNRAKSYSGAITVSNSATVVLNNVIFENNWAGTQGGAIRSNFSIGKLLFAMTESGGTSNYSYTGNFASGTTGVVGLYKDENQNIVDTQVVENSPTFNPHARGGGFYYAASSGTTEFNIASGVTLTIGSATAANRNYDTIASATTTAKINKTGGGDLVVNANNSHFSGTTYVSSGRLLLGNDEAKYGGTIILSTLDASFGGSGTVTSRLFDDSVSPTSVSVTGGGAIQVGVSDRAAQQLTIDGNLTLSGGMLSYVAFGGTHVTNLNIIGTFTTSGVNTVNMQSYKTGIYTLDANASKVYTASGRLSVNGGLVVAGGRHSAVVTASPANLQVNLTVDKSRAMKWTGDQSTTWDSASDNWESLLDPSIKKFAAGDTVLFDTDATGDVTVLLSTKVPVVGIEVSGNNTITFGGSSMINAVPYQVGDEAEDSVMAGTGKLTKRGFGTIIFANEVNEFRGGIDIVDGGAIKFNGGGVIRTGAAPITFMQTATLCALGDSVLANKIVINTSKTAEIDVAAETTTQMTGIISGGHLLKTGEGALILAGANTHEATTLQSGTLRAAHATALGVNALAIASNDTTLEIANGLTIANGINMGSHNLNLNKLGTGSITMSGNINGTGVLTVSGSGVQNFSGNNSLASLVMTPGVNIAARHLNALGGTSSAVVMNTGAILDIGYAVVQAKSLDVDGAKVRINSFALGEPLLKLSNSMILRNDAIIELGALVPSGGYILAEVPNFEGVSGIDFTVLPGSNNVTYRYDIGYDTATGHVNLIVIKPDVNPTKDILSAFDGMSVIMGAVNSRISESFLSPISDERQGGHAGDFWLKGIGSFGDYTGDSNKVGFKDATYGFLAGLDRVFAERYLGGLYAGYTHSTVDTDYDISHTSADTLFAGAYGTVLMGKFHATADIMIGSLAVDSRRYEGIAAADGEYRSTVFGASAEAGYKLVSWGNGGITPSLSLQYMDYRFRDHRENGPGAMFLEDFNTSMLQGFASVKTNYGFVTPWNKPGMIDILAGYRFSLKDYTTTLSGVFGIDVTNEFHLQTEKYTGDALVVGLAVRIALTRKSAFALTYDYETSKTHVRNTVSANVCWSW